MGNETSKLRLTRTLSRSLTRRSTRQRPFRPHPNAAAYHLPLELWVLILSYLPPPAVWRLRIVSRTFRTYIEDYVSSPWLRDSCIVGLRGVSNGGLAFKIEDRVTDSSPSVGAWKLLGRDERFFVFELPKGSGWDFRRLQALRRARAHTRSRVIMISLQKDIRDEIPVWIKILERKELSLVISTRQFRVGSSIVLKRMVSSGGQGGFEVMFEETPSLLRIDWRVLFSAMFVAPQFSYTDR